MDHQCKRSVCLPEGLQLEILGSTILITVGIYFQVERIEKQEDGVEETVHYIMNVVTAAYRQNKNKPISYFELVINPDSFGATVENIFHVSFLVKDGYIDFSWGMYISSMLQFAHHFGNTCW